MVETQKEKEDRLRREAEAKARTGGDTSFVPVETLPEGRKTTTSDTDWEKIKHPGTMPSSEDPYGTRPVSELTPPPVVTDKADLAAVRMMDREKADREQMDRDRIMTEASAEAAAARAAMTSKETTRVETEADRERMRKAALVGGAGAAATRTSPEAGERTTRQGAAIDTGTTARHVTEDRPVTGTVIPPTTTTPTTRITPVTTTTTPLMGARIVDERTRMHAEDQSVHPDWETQPQINAPKDVGIPTAEGQADAARIRAGRRRSDEAEEPRIDRRGGDYEVPAASGARTGPMKEKARDIKEDTKAKARDVKEDVDRKI